MNKTNFVHFVSATLLTILFSLSVNAFTGASSAAIGNTGTGISDPKEFLDLNPATLAAVKGYLARAGYSQNQDHQQVLGLSLADNEKETIVPGALSYTGTTVMDNREQDLKLSFGNSIRKDVAVGLGVHYADMKIGEDTHRQLNGTLGALYTMNSRFSVGAVASDIIPSQSDTFRLAPRFTVGSSLLVANAVRLRADVGSSDNYTFGRPLAGVGAEGHLTKWLVGRAGYLIDRDQNNDGWTAGFGLLSRRISLHYAFQDLQKEQAHFFDLSLPL